MLAHASWDTAGAVGIHLLGDRGALWLVALVVVGVAIVVVAGRDAAKSERVWAHAILTPEADAGVISRSELEAVSGTHRDRRRFVKTHPGHHQRKTAKHVLTAARELGVTIGRDEGHDTIAVEHARSEITRLRSKI